MAAAHHSALSLPPPANMERLPSIKELHFAYHRSPPSQSAHPPQNGAEHAQQQQQHPPRHENVSWGRGAPAAAPPSQHSPPMPPPPDHPRSSQQPAHKSDGQYAQPGHPYAHQQLQHGPSGVGKPRGDSSQSSSKRGRSSSTVSASSGRSPHAAYPPGYPQQSPSPYHQVPGAPTPQPPPEPVPQQSPYAAPTTAYAYAAPPPPTQQMAPRQPYPAQPPAPHQPSASRPPPQYHAQQQSHEPWQAQPPPQQPPAHAPPPPQQQYQQQQPPFEGFSTRTTPIVPTPAEPRNSAPPPPPPPAEQERAYREGIIHQIMHYCNSLLGFANKYGQAAPSQPHPQELREMTQFANIVVRLLEDLRRMTGPEDKREPAPPAPVPEDNRPPKRPWEDMSRGDAAHPEYADDTTQSTAEQDMEIIRSKRATSSGATTPGQPKSKYRKRSRATPPGKCHSCNIRETPEWRRGPDGARTLCNACGLHYAKLMRKRDKALGADGKPIPIDLQTLRLSTASSRGNAAADSGGEPSGQSAPPPNTSPPQHHQPHPQQPHPQPHQHQQQQQHPSQGVVATPYEPPKSGQHPHPQEAHHHPPPPPHAQQYHMLPPSGQSSPTAGAPPPHHPHEQPVGGAVPPPPWYVPDADRYGNTFARQRQRGSPH